MATTKRNSYDTDMFFIIESLTIYFEKILDIMDEPLKNYTKSEWFKFKELLTSPDLQPCKCFSYANTLKLIKPLPAPVKVATFNLGDLGEQSNSLQQTPLMVSSKKPESIIQIPSLIALNSTVSPPSHSSNTTNNIKTSSLYNNNQGQLRAIPEVKDTEKKTKNSIVNLQQNGALNLQTGNNPQYTNTLSPPQQTHQHQYQQNQSQPQLYISTQPSMNSISSSPNKQNYGNLNNNSQTYTNLSSQNGKSNYHSNQSSSSSNQGNGNYNNLSTPNSNVKSIQHTLQNLSQVNYSVQNTYTTPQSNGVQNRQHSNSINSSINVNSINLQSHINNQSNYTSTASNKDNNNEENRLRSPNVSNHFNYMQTSKNNGRASATSASRLKSINQLNSTPSQLQLSSKKSPSQLDKIISTSKTPQTNYHMKAQKSLQIDIKENNLSSRNNGLSNPSITSSTSTQGKNINSIGNLLSSSKQIHTTVSINAGNSASHLFTSIGSSQNSNKLAVPGYSAKKFEGSSMTDRIRDKPQMNSIKTESVLIENSPPQNPNNYSSNNTNYNNTTASSSNNNQFANLNANPSNSILNLGLKQSQQQLSPPIQAQPIQLVNLEHEASPSNMGLNPANPPIRKKARRETRKLSLEKFQNNIDAIQRASELEENGGVTPKAHNKGFQQVLMNRFDLLNAPAQNADKKRDPSPVNKRIACNMIQGIHDLQKLKGEEEPPKENPYKHLIQLVHQRINVFKMDSTTIELVSGKFTDIDETKRHRDIVTKQGGSGAGAVGGGFQDRVEIKRDKLKKYSVFAKKGQDQQNLKKVDDQISRDEQQKLVNPLVKAKKREEKKLIF